MKEIKDNLDGALKLYCWTSPEQKLPTNETWTIPLEPIISEVSPILPPEVEKGGFHDKLVYIYTSGTTGLPKAAVVTNSRYIEQYSMFIMFLIIEMTSVTLLYV